MKKKNFLIPIIMLLISVKSFAETLEDDGPPTDDPALPISTWIPFFLIIAILFSFFYFRNKINTSNTLK